jgi:hypothetical protein
MSNKAKEPSIWRIMRRKFRLRRALKKKDFVFVHRKKTHNIGDLSCCPLDFFEDCKNSLKVDIIEFEKYPVEIKNKVVILGGGGLLQEFFREALENLIQHCENCKIIVWSIGFDNLCHEKKFNADIIKNCDLVGLRDVNTEFDYTPCPSCLSELFDKYKDAEIKRDVIAYLHTDLSDGMPEFFKDIPVFKNKDPYDLGYVLDFLSSASVVVTNSYHGAFWATLLNRKAIIIPFVKDGNTWFSEKFTNYKFQPVLCEDWQNYKNCLNQAIAYPEALTVCRDDSYKFLQKAAGLTGLKPKYYGGTNAKNIHDKKKP